MKKRSINIVGPMAFAQLKVTAPKSFAAGVPAVKAALDHALKEMGLFRSVKALSGLNQKEGIDCPGCAWPDPSKRSSLGEFCENGVKAIAEEATLSEANPDFFARHSVSEMSNWTDFQIGKSGRITHPMILETNSDHYKPIKWNDAFKLVGDNLRSLKNPDEAIFYTSGRSSNEAAFLYGLFARAFGTNNLPDCSNMCHESSGVALKETLGIGKGSVTLEDFEDAEVIMVIGQNPGTNHPRMLSALQKCKENGGIIISVNPLKEAGLIKFKNPQQIGGITSGTKITDIFLQVKINQDVALLKLIMKRLIALDHQKGNVLDHEFIRNRTTGFSELIEDLNNYRDDELLEICGVARQQVEETVSILAKKQKIIICWAMGLTQHKNAVDNIKECVNLLLMKGSIGKKGAGTCPVRGHSNVQGDRTVGIMHHVNNEFNQAIQKTFGFEPPATEGLDVVHSIKAMHAGLAKVFIALGGNFVSAAPDTIYTGEALMNCCLTVSISTKLNRTHLVTGKTALILPVLGRTEVDKQRFLTVENSMGRVHRTEGRLKPISKYLKSEPEVVAGIAQSYFQGESNIDWKMLGEDYDAIRAKISEVIEGFNNYSERSQDAGFNLPNMPRIGKFNTSAGDKAIFSICKNGVAGLKQGQYLLATIRTHDQFNTTIYGMDDRYRGIYNERRVVLMNAQDAAKEGLKEQDVVNLMSKYKGIERKASNFKVIYYDMPSGNLAAYFPETNVLIPYDEFADKSQTPISKSVVVRIEKV